MRGALPCGNLPQPMKNPSPRPLTLPFVTTTRSERGTAGVARRLAAQLATGDVIGLVGELGAGKTAFVRGLARALGVPSSIKITSPTFTVVNTIEGGRLRLHHFDLYRLVDVDELEAIGYRDFVGTDGVALFEWADRVPSAIPASGIWVVIEDSGPGNERRISITAGRPRAGAS
ncbi:MAG: tRNA (adenosine(37)-N6)-threonylcarbamoyltransferase complex ATPase subunit type 1 TsaE [Myxococcales bacterium]|nr:tRNA (adenosine(37)-N6)-threonylcarbamoyltransferase complex ATPase subunit type 1 TsaE [Myxococcales bacterium]